MYIQYMPRFSYLCEYYFFTIHTATHSHFIQYIQMQNNDIVSDHFGFDPGILDGDTSSMPGRIHDRREATAEPRNSKKESAKTRKAAPAVPGRISAFLHERRRRIFTGICGQNCNHRDGDHTLCQVQHTHPICLGSTEQCNKKRNAQHAGLLGGEDLGQVVVGVLFLPDSEGPYGTQNHKGNHQRHGGYGFHSKISGQTGIKQNTGQAEFHDELL